MPLNCLTINGKNPDADTEILNYISEPANCIFVLREESSGEKSLKPEEWNFYCSNRVELLKYIRASSRTENRDNKINYRTMDDKYKSLTTEEDRMKYLSRIKSKGDKCYYVIRLRKYDNNDRGKYITVDENSLNLIFTLDNKILTLYKDDTGVYNTGSGDILSEEEAKEFFSNY